MLILEGTARYADFLLALVEDFGLQPRPFHDLWAKEEEALSCPREAMGTKVQGWQMVSKGPSLAKVT